MLTTWSIYVSRKCTHTHTYNFLVYFLCNWDDFFKLNWWELWMSWKKTFLVFIFLLIFFIFIESSQSDTHMVDVFMLLECVFYMFQSVTIDWYSWVSQNGVFNGACTIPKQLYETYWCRKRKIAQKVTLVSVMDLQPLPWNKYIIISWRDAYSISTIS